MPVMVLFKITCQTLVLTLLEGSRMAEGLTHLPLDQKVQGSIPGSNILCSCHCGGSNSHKQAHEVYFHSLLSGLSVETLNRGPESIAQVVPAR